MISEFDRYFMEKILDDLRIRLYPLYPSFKKTIDKKINFIGKIYVNYLEETKFVYDEMLENFRNEEVSEESVIKFDEEYRNSDYGKGDHVINYVSELLEDLIVELDRRQNLKDFDDN